MNSVISFLKQRRSVMIRTLSPCPLPEIDLLSILECGIRVPDHGMLTPWRIIVISGKQRKKLGKCCLRTEFARLNQVLRKKCLNLRKTDLPEPLLFYV